MSLERIQAHRMREGRHRFKVYAYPVFPGSGWIRIGDPGDACEADDRLAGDTVVEEHLVTLLHGLEVVSCLKVANARPGCALVLDELFPRIGGGLLFDQPVTRLRAHF